MLHSQPLIYTKCTACLLVHVLHATCYAVLGFLGPFPGFKSDANASWMPYPLTYVRAVGPSLNRSHFVRANDGTPPGPPGGTSEFDHVPSQRISIKLDTSYSIVLQLSYTSMTCQGTRVGVSFAWDLFGVPPSCQVMHSIIHSTHAQRNRRFSACLSEQRVECPS
jgi:hypothetical protein